MPEITNWSPVGRGISFDPEPAGIFRRVVGDSAVDLAKGAVGLGQSAVGVADLATAGLAGDALHSIGYDPQRTDEILSQYYSPQRQAAEEAVGNTQGFGDRVGALVQNPSALIGRGVQAAPQLLGLMGIGRMAAARALAGGASEAEALATAGKVTSAGNAIATAGGVSQDIRDASTDPDRGRWAQYAAIPAGLAVGATDLGMAKLLPEAQLETLLAGGATHGGRLARAGAGSFSEALKGGVQNASQQIASNYGLGRPLDYGLGATTAEGALLGGALGTAAAFRRSAMANREPTSLLPDGNPGLQGDLFSGAGSMEPNQRPAEAAPDFQSLVRHGAMLAELERQAREAGDPDMVADLQAEQRQVAQQLQALAPPPGPGQRGLMSGVNEMVNGRPVELTNDELVGNRIPYVPTGFDPNSLEARTAGLEARTAGLQLQTPDQNSLPFEQVPLPPVEPTQPAARTRPLTADELSYQGQPVGDMQPVPQADPRVAEARAALREANGGRNSKSLLDFTGQFLGALDDPQAMRQVLDNAAASPKLKPEVVEKAEELAATYQQQKVNAMAREGEQRAQPGMQQTAPDVGNATEQAMRERNAQEQQAGIDQQQQALEQQRQASMLADINDRVAASDKARADASRRDILESVLDGAANPGNAFNRFIRALRKAGIRDTIVRPEEQQTISRFFEAKDAFTGENPETEARPQGALEEGPPAPSAPNEFDPYRPAKETNDAVQERSAAPVDVREQPRDGQALAGRDTQGREAPAEGEPPVQPKEQGQRPAKDIRSEVNQARLEAEAELAKEKRASDLAANTPQAPDERAAMLKSRFDKLRNRDTALDLNDERAIQDHLDKGNLDEAAAKMSEVEKAMREGLYRTREAEELPQTKTHVSDEELNSALDEVRKALPDAPPIEVHDTPEAAGIEGPAAGTPMGVRTGDGRIILFRKGLANKLEALTTAFHELFHHGLRNLGLSADEYHGQMDRLYKADPVVQKYAHEWGRSDEAKALQAAGMSDRYMRSRAIEEALARISEDLGSQRPGVIRNIANWLAGVADRFGMKELGQYLRRAPLSEAERFVQRALDGYAGREPEPPKGSKPMETNPDAQPAFRTVREDVERTYGQIKDKLRYDVLTKAKALKLSSSFNHNIAERYGKELPAIKEHIDAINRSGATRAELLTEANKVVAANNAVRGAEKTAVAELMADATLHGIVLEPGKFEYNGRTTTYDNSHLTPEEMVRAKALQEKFAKLSDAAKESYRQSRDALRRNFSDKVDAINRQTMETYQPLIDEARRAGNEKQVRVLTREMNDFIRETAEPLAQLKGDYFPLMRYGDWVVTRKSGEFKATQEAMESAYEHLNKLLAEYDNHTPEERKAILKANKKLEHLGADTIEAFTPEQHAEIKAARDAYNALRSKLDTMKGQDNHYYMAKFESRSDAENDAKLKHGQVSLSTDSFKELSPVSRAALDRMQESLAMTLKGSGDTVTALRDAKKALYQTFLASLPDRSALKNQMRRKNVSGFSSDMQRGVATSLMRDSFYLSRLKHSDEIMSSLKRATEQAKESGNIELQQVANELAKRQALAMKYIEPNILNPIAAWTHVAVLGISPAYLINNQLQPFVVSAPMLVARNMTHTKSAVKSVSNVTRELGHGMADAAKMAVNSIKQNLHGNIDYRNAGLDENEVRMLDRALEAQALTVSLTHDVMTAADGSESSKIANALGSPSHHGEVINRIGTALAAYRLEVAQGMSHDRAVEHAIKALNDTHINYSVDNSPYWMRPGVFPLGKLLFQFKKYQLGMFSLWAKNAYNAVKGESPEVRAEARRTIAGLTATHGMMAGLLGLPGMGAITTLATLLKRTFGDDDQFDAESEIRNYFHDLVGKEAGDALSKGLPAFLLGADMSKKAGLGDLLSPVHVMDTGGHKTLGDMYKDYLASAAGPALGGLGFRYFQGLQHMIDGDYVKGVESFLPKFIADPIKAGRFATEGVTTNKGAQFVSPDEVSGWDTFLQAAGFSPNDIADKYEQRTAVEDAKQGYADAASKLEAKWVTAHANGDGEKADEIMQQIREELNPQRREAGLPPITMSQLLKAAQQRRQQERDYARYGASVGKNVKLAERGRFGQDDE